MQSERWGLVAVRHRWSLFSMTWQKNGYRMATVATEFSGSDQGGQALATLASFTATCELLKLNPWPWLRDTLTRLPVTRRHIKNARILQKLIDIGLTA